MTNTTITPGARLNGFEVLSVDPTGKRRCVSCPCRAVHIFSAESLLNGTATWIAVKPTSEQLNARRAEKARRPWRERDWRPGR